MEIMADLRVMLGSLAREDGVFGRVAAADTGTVEEHVYRLVLDAHEAWADYAVKDARGPTGPADIRGALEAIDAEQATDVMTYLSAGDLVFPGRMRRDREHAHRAARRVVKLLGYEATWSTNIELSDAGYGWNPVTRHSFDGVVAGVGNGVVVALLQVGED
ncbi:hypothetical protein LUW77_20365 [Streptomyces radiopugnans]|uniref:hypothetical protein n=1 Tax=Streptomyces sp. KL2 TaxID=3050126 RepID=UPI0021896B0D|nr:hypothetical protein LUW77_20365 [Streptomyces radiopugnans]